MFVDPISSDLVSVFFLLQISTSFQKLIHPLNYYTFNAVFGVGVMTLSRFRKLQKGCKLIISMIRNLCQEFSK